MVHHHVRRALVLALPLMTAMMAGIATGSADTTADHAEAARSVPSERATPFLPEPPHGPLTLDSWLAPGNTTGTTRLHYQWSVVGTATNTRLHIALDPGITWDQNATPATTTLPANGTAQLDLVIESGPRHAVHLELSAHVDGREERADRTHYLTVGSAGLVEETAGHDWASAPETALTMNDEPDNGTLDTTNVTIDPVTSLDGNASASTFEPACILDFVAHVRTANTVALPANMRDQAVPHVTVAVHAPDGTRLAAAVADAAGVATFPAVPLPACDLPLQLRTELRWADNGTWKIVMSPADSDAHWTQTWPLAHIQGGDRVTLRHSTSLSPQAYMLPQAIASYQAVTDAGFDMPTVKIHRTEGLPVPPGCGACARDDHIWFDGRTRTSEANDHTLYHEYGHNVHHSLTPPDRPGPSYGQHTGCLSFCHHWDSVHGTTGSAFSEAWSNVFAAAVTGDPTHRFNLESPDRSRTDHPDLACWGPHRECSVAAALWDTYAATGHNLTAFLRVLTHNPQDVHAFEQHWDLLAHPNGDHLDRALRRHHITPNGDGLLQGDADSHAERPGFTPYPEGTLSYDPHQPFVDRSDSYQLDMPAGEHVDVYLQPPSGQGSRLLLYDAQGVLVANATNVPDNGTTPNGTTTPGTLHVNASADTHNAGTWSFRIEQEGTAQGRYVWAVRYADDPPDPASP